MVSGWMVALLITVPAGFLAFFLLLAWLSHTGRYDRFGRRYRAWAERHPVPAVLVPLSLWYVNAVVGLVLGNPLWVLWMAVAVGMTVISFRQLR